MVEKRKNTFFHHVITTLCMNINIAFTHLIFVVLLVYFIFKRLTINFFSVNYDVENFFFNKPVFLSTSCPNFWNRPIVTRNLMSYQSFLYFHSYYLRTSLKLKYVSLKRKKYILSDYILSYHTVLDDQAKVQV